MKPSIAIILAFLVVGIVGWAFRDRLALMVAPNKEAITSRSEAASKADDLFWETFHNGEYDEIWRALDVLTSAYLRTPNDAKTAAHIAWLHNWRVAERARMDSIPATITDDTIVARRYFQEAVKLDPSDVRYLGFLAGHTLADLRSALGVEARRRAESTFAAAEIAPLYQRMYERIVVEPA